MPVGLRRKRWGVAVNQPVVNIVGEQAALGPLPCGALPSLKRWHNDVVNHTCEKAGFRELARRSGA
jgi:hypothetical protein